jgi:hypothetical protein
MLEHADTGDLVKARVSLHVTIVQQGISAAAAQSFTFGAGDGVFVLALAPEPFEPLESGSAINGA